MPDRRSPSSPDRVLIVEDDPASRTALRTILSRQGWMVDAVATLAEGLAHLQHHPDAVVLDLMLPDGDGATLLEYVRSHGLASRVVVTTGVGDEARLERTRRLGPARLLRKPIHLPELLAAIQGPKS